MADGYLVSTIRGSSYMGVFDGDKDDGTEVVNTDYSRRVDG